jgi:hypothetical protein
MTLTLPPLKPDDVVAIHRPGGRIAFAVIVDQGGRPTFQLESGRRILELESDVERVERVDVAGELADLSPPSNRMAWLQALEVAAAAAQIKQSQPDVSYAHTLHGMTRGQIALRWLELRRGSILRLADANPGPVLALKIPRGDILGELIGSDLALSCARCPNTELVSGYLLGNVAQRFEWPSATNDGHIRARCRCGATYDERVALAR